MNEEKLLMLLLEAWKESNDCNEIVSESYEPDQMGDKWVIKHKVTYNCGITDVRVYPDIRKDLHSMLAKALTVEDYERAAELRDTLDNLQIENHDNNIG